MRDTLSWAIQHLGATVCPASIEALTDLAIRNPRAIRRLAKQALETIQRHRRERVRAAPPTPPPPPACPPPPRLHGLPCYACGAHFSTMRALR
eukprot:10865965-Lingulodinium_polyedra.AAC.1